MERCGTTSEAVSWHGKKNSILATAPLAAVVFKFRPRSEKSVRKPSPLNAEDFFPERTIYSGFCQQKLLQQASLLITLTSLRCLSLPRGLPRRSLSLRYLIRVIGKNPTQRINLSLSVFINSKKCFATPYFCRSLVRHAPFIGYGFPSVNKSECERFSSKLRHFFEYAHL